MSIDASEVVSKQAILHAAALLVALCSFGYELVYSELLTVMYGGTVTQYGLTIGIFFSSLGLGSYLAKHFDDATYENFFRTELYLAAVAPLGALFVLWINVTEVPAVVPAGVLSVAARLPVVAIGVLSGFELPLLLSMVESETRADAAGSPMVDRLVNRVDAAAYAIVSIPFSTDRASEDYDTYSTVLAMDYLGGLLGALVYVFVLFPRLGLLPSVFALALLNGVAAIAFAARFSARPWGLFGGEDRVVVTHERTAVFLACLLLTGLYAGVAANHTTVDRELTEYYVEGLIEQEYPRDTMRASVTDQYTTQYQEVIRYERTWVGESDPRFLSGTTDTCMRLDTAIQVCDSWARSYHHGLVDVPMTMYDNGTETDVLLVGGGDWIAVDRLRAHDVTVEQVDIDGEFLERSKDDEFLAQYHDDAYEYEHLTTHERDIYEYLQGTEETYDLILLDLPGAKSDDSLRLYSTELYTMLREHLGENGVVVTWAYSRYAYAQHHEAYVNTVSSAGFDRYQAYYAYDDFNGDGQRQRGERFFVFAPDDDRPTIDPDAGTGYVRQHADRYGRLQWEPIPEYRGVRANSVFHPNYDIIIDDRVRTEVPDEE